MRVYTGLLYLNTPLAGGATRFPELGLDVHPKSGRLLLFASLSDDDLTKMEPRTVHEALPVTWGAKLIANVWVRMYNENLPRSRLCRDRL